MENSVKSKLVEFKNIAYSLLTIQIPEYSSEYEKNKTANEIFGNIAGKLPEILGISNMIGSRKVKSVAVNYLNNTLKKQIEMQKHNAINSINTQLENLINELKSFLLTVSVTTNNLSLSGNSHILIKKMNRIYRYNTIHRKIIELINVLDEIGNLELIENNEIALYLQSREPPNRLGMELLNSLENCLRNMLRNEGRRMFGSNYENIIPQRIKEKAKKRLIKRDFKDGGQEYDLFSYLDFSNYLCIITWENNWKYCFSLIFPNKEWIKIKIEEISPIRNALAHSRKITKDQIDRLRINSNDIIKIIKTFSKF
jgi:hypothetical protein